MYVNNVLEHYIRLLYYGYFGHISQSQGYVTVKKWEGGCWVGDGCVSSSVIALDSFPLKPENKFNITSKISANMMCANQASECCLVYFWLYK